MPLNIRSEEVNQLAEKLARARRTTKTEAVKLALVEALGKEEKKVPLAERIKDIQDEIASYPETGLKADKAFYDWLSED
jgi:antitoxin VapB